MVFGRDAMGMAYIRSGWGSDDTFITFRAGHRFSHHGHQNNGAFTLFKRKPLAINSSTYTNIFSPNRLNYAIRTIAKNSLLILRPDEMVKTNRAGTDNVSDGGQRVVMPTGSAITDIEDWEFHLDKGQHLKGGSIESFQTKRASYSYVKADLTDAYNTPQHDEGGNGGKVEKVTRQLLYLDKEDRLIVYDHVVATDPEFTKKWLLHTIHRPDINSLKVLNGDSQNGILESSSDVALINNEAGTLHLQRILPEKGVFRLVGGEDYQYYVEVDGDDAQLNGINMSEGASTKPWFDAGNWRIEIQPTLPNLEDRFLVALTPRLDSASVERLQSLKILSGDAEGIISSSSISIFLNATQSPVVVDLPKHQGVLRVVFKVCSQKPKLIDQNGKVHRFDDGQTVLEMDLQEVPSGNTKLLFN
jgi:hypothetical protein